MRSRSSRRAAGALVAAAMTLVLGAWPGQAVVDADADARDGIPLAERHLPTVVNAPGTWSTVQTVRWPVAALGVSTRTEPVGIFGESESLGVFAVSAVDGSASWIRLPGLSRQGPGPAGDVNVSPDGEWIGWARLQQSRGSAFAGRVAGWSVMNTTTGQVRRLDVRGFPWVRATMSDLAFSGDSRYLLTSYETPDQRKASRSRGHQLVAWDVEDATPTVLEEPGPYWLPSLGSAPTGVAWARGREVFRVDPGAGERTTVTLPQHVITASWGPDDASFAYIGRPSVKSKAPWRLYAGRTVAEARDRQVDLPADIDVGQLLGWRDPTHVVVGHYRSSVHVVDVVTGEVETIDLRGYGEQLNAPYLASALWQQPLVAPVAPEGTTDPRRPWRWFSLALLVLLAGVILALWRRSRPADRSDPAPADRSSDPAYVDTTPPLPSLRPLATVATGLILVVLDFRVQGVDLIPDPVGWVMAALALTALRTIHRGFSVAGVAAWLAVLPSVPEWFGAESAPIAASTALAMLVTQFATCTAVMAVSPPRAASASAVRWLTLGLGCALLLTAAAATVEPSMEVIAVVMVLALLAVTVWFLVLLYGAAKDVTPYAGARPPA
ncbi:MAG: hypothetical protein WBP61_15010 [Nocardioides sp.]